jgi:protein gp138
VPVTPTLPELLRAAVDAGLEEVWGAAPGTVLSYDPATQSADVEVGVRRAVPSDRGAPVVERAPVVANVPVAFPGGGGFFVSFPLGVGDRVLLVFADRSIDRYRQTGTSADPGDRRALGPAGAIAVPCAPLPVLEVLADADAAEMVAGQDGGVQTRWTGAVVKLSGASDVELVARADRVEAQLSALKTAISGAAVVAGDGGAALKANILAALASWPGSTGADKAKVT